MGKSPTTLVIGFAVFLVVFCFSGSPGFAGNDYEINKQINVLLKKVILLRQSNLTQNYRTLARSNTGQTNS